jgi:hypothetical protein
MDEALTSMAAGLNGKDKHTAATVAEWWGGRKVVSPRHGADNYGYLVRFSLFNFGYTRSSTIHPQKKGPWCMVHFGPTVAIYLNPQSETKKMID